MATWPSRPFTMFLMGCCLLALQSCTRRGVTVSAFSVATPKDAVHQSGKDSTLAPQPTSSSLESLQRVLVVGGGVGGLAVAARIAASTKSSFQVTILEKNDQVGGRCGSVDIQIPGRGTFRHDRGPSLLLLPNVYQELFQACQGGASSEDYGLLIRPCQPAYQVVFDDGDRIDLGFPKQQQQQSQSQPNKDTIIMSEQEVISRRKMDSYESNGASKWDEYMRAMSAFLDCGLPNFIEERLDLTTFPSFLREALRDFGKAWPLKPHSDVLDAIFESEKMRALASFQDLYVGLEPYRNQQQLVGGVWTSTAPAVFGLLAAIELHPSNKYSGVFAPIGGFRAVTTAFQRLAESKGVQILTNHAVVKVEGSGVHVLDQDSETPKFMPADLIVVNADLPFATKCLLSGDAARDERKVALNDEVFDWDDKFDFSSGVIAFHWSLNKRLDDLNTHNVFLMGGSRSQAEASWRILRNGIDKAASSNDATGPFNFYVHRARKTDPTAAPEGCDAVMILVPCQTLQRKEEYAGLSRSAAMKEYAKQFDEDCIAQVRTAVLKRLSVIPSLQNVKDCILHEFVDTPATYADLYNLAAGAPFSLSHGFGQLSIMRPGAHVAQNPNILMVGASSRPGNGVPLVLIGAKLVAEKALQRLQELSRTAS